MVWHISAVVETYFLAFITVCGVMRGSHEKERKLAREGQVHGDHFGPDGGALHGADQVVYGRRDDPHSLSVIARAQEGHAVLRLCLLI